MSIRCLRSSLRQLDSLITAVVLPVMLMLMFVYLFGGALQTPTSYVDYVVPGVLAVCIGFGTATTAVSVASDLTGGVIDRFRSMDVSGPAVLAGHVAASLMRNLLSTAVLLAVAFAIGFRPDAGAEQWLVAVVLLAAFITALSWFAAAVGTTVGSVEAASGVTFLVSFLPYPSSAFVPISTMPSWLQGFARNQPVNCLVDALRHLLLGQPVGASVVLTVLWSTAIAAVSIAMAAWRFRSRTA